MAWCSPPINIVIEALISWESNSILCGVQYTSFASQWFDAEIFTSWRDIGISEEKAQ
ncbi:hypothetical protein [Ochrobactrum chromiisoli]|uniref:Uncharacterized protein n=1 Tax=Ochrobactrum chromiisoli TaxID=2993941 RepID=A0ABT3QMC5_9HYPH|nr:hypothetical protein [Ochrobactrum chromiisoli]MCX2696769.1 hypothetical protein [Ochrobactrum chromiisoli]